MHRVLLRVVVFLVIAAMALFLEAFGLVMIAGEVSCYEVCSPVSDFVGRYEPWPQIAGLLVAVAAGWGASLLAKPL